MRRLTPESVITSYSIHYTKLYDFLKTFSEEFGRDIRGLAPNAMVLLESYPFPGNVRELENVIERATVLAEGEFIP